MRPRLITTLLFITGVGFHAVSQPIHVPGDQPSIQAGIDVATDGDTVLVADSTYYENINFKGKAITVASQFLLDRDTSHISKTIIDGSQASDPAAASVVTIKDVSNSTSVLAGFTIAHGSGSRFYYYGYAMTGGGGIFLQGCGATIKNNVIESNLVNSAVGGILINPGETDTVKITNNVICNNEVRAQGTAAAGGVWVMGAKKSVIYIHDNRISGNKVFVEDIYKAIGGGISIETDYSFGADIQIFNNIIDQNELHCQASHGGGIFVNYQKNTSDPTTEAQVKIYNNLISNNYSEESGAGIAVWRGGSGIGKERPEDPIIANNTIVGNKAINGAGLWNYDAATVMFNNILWNDLSSTGSSEIYNGDVNYPDWGWDKDQNDGIIYGGYNNIQSGWEGIGNMDADPKFDTNSFGLAEGSPGIGWGVDSFEIGGIWYNAPSLDLYGNPRPHLEDSRVDIGAIESPFEGFVYIPDTDFLYALIGEGVDTNNDSLISYAEAETLTSLTISGWESRMASQSACIPKISNLKGIESFINLDSLAVRCTSIDSLILSNNLALTFLYCSSNPLDTLDISNNIELKTLFCSYNNITSLKLPLNGSLEYLEAESNALIEIDVSTNPLLTHLNLRDNALEAIEISGLPLLTSLDLRINNLSLLNVSACSNLENLKFCLNNISKMDISNCTLLENFWASANQFESIDFSMCNRLSVIYLQSMPTLKEVCVWNGLDMDEVRFDTTDSPNVHFTTECTIGVEENSSSGLSIYPNPTNNLLTIETDHPDKNSIEVNSLNGQLISNTKMEGTSHQIDLSSFQKGIYFITIRSKDFVTTRKIIKM